MSTSHPLSKAALLTLARVWPKALAFDDLLARTSGSLRLSQVPKSDCEALLTILFEGYASGLVRIQRVPPKTAADVADIACACRLARWQACRQALVTNLLHELVHIEDELSRRLLCLLDGTRDLNAVVVELEKDAGAGEGGKMLDRAALQAALRGLARVGLLVSTGEEPELPAAPIQPDIQTETGVAATNG